MTASLRVCNERRGALFDVARRIVHQTSACVITAQLSMLGGFWPGQSPLRRIMVRMEEEADLRAGMSVSMV